MNRLIFIAASSMIFLSMSALADDSGVYLGAGFAGANIFSTSCADGSFFTSCNTPSRAPKDNKAQLRLIGGYDFNKHFGIEAGLSQLGTYRVKDSANLVVGELKESAFTLAVKAGNTFPNGFSVFGKLGLASVRTKYTTQPGWTLVGSADQRSIGYVGGVIGQYNINNIVGFRMSLEIIDYTDAEFHNFTGGIAMMAVFKL